MNHSSDALHGAVLAAFALCLMPIAAFGAGASTHTDETPVAIKMDYQIEPDGSYRLHEVFNLPVRSSSNARQLAQQSFGWSTGLEKLTTGVAYTLKASGARIPIGVNAILNQAVSIDSDFPSFSDWQMRTIVFPDLRSGDVAHYELTRESVTPLFPGAFEASLHFAASNSVEISVDAPASMALHIVASNLFEGPADKAGLGRSIRHWHISHDAAASSADWAASTFLDYAALGQAYAERANPKAAPDDAIRALARRLTAGITDRRDQARTLYNYVATQIRYVGLQLGSGRIVPRPASIVLATGYGDCKDHAVLLQALLASANIVAEPALISSKSRYDLPMPATLDVLDHVILFLPEFSLWLDATSGFAPFGILPIGEYGKPVVLVGPNTPGAIARVDHVPSLGPGYAWARTQTELSIADDGALSGDTETTAGGPYAVALREIADGLGDAHDQLQRLGTPGIGQFDYDPARALSSDNYRVNGRFTLEDGIDDLADLRLAPPPGLTVMVRPGGFLVSDASVAGQDDSAAHLCYNGVQEEEIRMHLPPSRDAGDLPKDVLIDKGFAKYSAQWRRDGADILIDRRFILNAPHPVCSGSEYQELRPVLRAARLDLHRRLLIQDRPQAIASAPVPARVQAVDARMIARP